VSIITTAEAKCQDCYRCLRSCPLHAIKFTRAAEEEAPIRAAVIEELCILDGQCVEVCPQQAKEVRRDLDIVQKWLEAGEYVTASVAPSFFGTLKRELIYGSRFETRAEARLAIFEYIEVFYNRIRLHSALNYMSPVEYELCFQRAA